MLLKLKPRTDSKGFYEKKKKLQNLPLKYAVSKVFYDCQSMKNNYANIYSMSYIDFSELEIFVVSE